MNILKIEKKSIINAAFLQLVFGICTASIFIAALLDSLELQFSTNPGLLDI